MAKGTVQQQIAAELGLSKGRISQLKAKGMPCDTVKAAKLWMGQHAGPVRKAKPSAVAEVVKEHLKTNPPPEVGSDGKELSGPEAILGRLREVEKHVHGLVKGAIAQAEATKKDEDYAMLPALMRTHGQAVQNRLEAENKWERYQRDMGDVAPVAHLMEVLRGRLEPLAAQLDNFPRTIAAQANPQNPAQAEKVIAAGLEALRRQISTAITADVPSAQRGN